jgi:hypothetical protein
MDLTSPNLGKLTAISVSNDIHVSNFGIHYFCGADLTNFKVGQKARMCAWSESDPKIEKHRYDQCVSTVYLHFSFYYYLSEIDHSTKWWLSLSFWADSSAFDSFGFRRRVLTGKMKAFNRSFFQGAGARTTTKSERALCFGATESRLA